MNTCVTCKHWDPYFGQAPESRRLGVRRVVWSYGDCTNPAFPASSYRPAPWDKPETAAEFGCTLWEEIPDV